MLGNTFDGGNMITGLNSNGNSGTNIMKQRNGGLVLGRNKDLDMNRSGSAPPTVEGALLAAGNLFRNPNFVQFEDSGSNTNSSDGIGVLTEEEIRSHPAYLEYYYSNENLNPRLPPPLLSKEDWRVAQRFRAAGGIGDRVNEHSMDNGRNSSLFSMQPGLSVKKAEDELTELRKAASLNLSRKSSADLMDKSPNGSAGVSGSADRGKSFDDVVQDNPSQHVISSLSRPSSRNSVRDVLDSTGIFNNNAAEVQNMQDSLEAVLPKDALIGFSGTQNVASTLPNSFASSASLSLTSSETELGRRSPSPALTNVGNKAHLGNKINSLTSVAPNFTPSGIFDGSDITASLSGLRVTNGQFHTDDMLKSSHQIGLSVSHQQNQQQQYYDMPGADMLVNNIYHGDLTRKNGLTRSFNISNSLVDESARFPRTSSAKIFQSQLNPSDYTNLGDLKIGHQGNFFPGGHISSHMQNGYAGNEKADMMADNDYSAGSLLTGPAGKGQNLRDKNHVGIHYPVMNPSHIQYIHGRNMVYIPENSSEGRYVNNVYDPENMQALEKAYLEMLLVQQDQYYQSHLLHKSISNNPHHGAFVPYATQYQEDMMLNSLHSKIMPNFPMFPNEKTSQISPPLRGIKGEPTGLLHPPSGKIMNARFESLLEGIKNNKSTLELSDILGYAVEFSMDQYGSRFIQQKLETATIDERSKIFKEIIPHARTLMVDVFGNYVVQKFFEHGTDSQRMELARHMIGHVLPLSLQMYGCRVIQKALEVVDVELQSEMIAELDGSVMKCVRDQNGNHVIQKCIECVPQNQVQSIILSFLGQVVTLSMHPYGCRVVQRVLEHCDDPKTQQIIMDEIMSSVYKLAQDRYGNYVIQHVLQHGKPHERTAIISKLAGQIVKMSQQKFASNVVEKCLTFGGPEERKLLVNEMLGSTDENEPLQAMMKDPFGNYVVQKVLETCDDKSHELVLSRIKVHLNALKKYTYGKHVVSRVEKLVATGERHTGEMIQV